jgi:predicted nucleic acid-binding protein
MTAEFVDTNILVYANDSTAGPKQAQAAALLEHLVSENRAAISTQVLIEFYSTITRKLGRDSRLAEEIIEDLAYWPIHRPTHADILHAIALQRRHKVSWWDALILTSAIQLGCSILWSEDISPHHKYGPISVRNPFA